MLLSDLDYPLPKDKIALFPTEDRPAAKLLCVDRASGACSHRIFRDLPELLRPTDLLVLNNTKVLPARLFGKRATGGKVEALLLKEVDLNVWEALLKPGGRIKDGERIFFASEIAAVPAPQGPRNDRHCEEPQRGDEAISLTGEVLPSAEPHSGKRRIRFEGEGVKEKIKGLGHIPLPPYIDRPDQASDRSMYQTVFAEQEGAVASPTAGLHFDKPLLEALARMGIEVAPVTLHVSYGTFQPITVEHVEEHQMFEEEYEITEEAARKINAAKRAGRRVIVCGTTCVRALESAAVAGGQATSACHSCEGGNPVLDPRLKHSGMTESKNPAGPFMIQPGKGKTSIFIYPPYEFKIVDGLITNFHMPKSTLLAMVSAFLGYEQLMAAYRTALQKDYRFASYGDAMLIS
jgi:S-adenosylmethionine:tRNA ribosyltransferase-isomerase